VRIITEEDATTLGVLEVVGSDKLYNKSQATALAKKSCGAGDVPMLCEYIEHGSSGRSVKRYLPIIKRKQKDEPTTKEI
jgi:hypothetical protein